MSDVENRVTRVLAQVRTDLDVAGMTVDADLIDEYGMDSLQMISFLLAVEDEFGIELDYENLDLADLRSVRQFAAYIAGLGVETQA